MEEISCYNPEHSPFQIHRVWIVERLLAEAVWKDDSNRLISLVKQLREIASSGSDPDEKNTLDPGVAAKLLHLACRLDSADCAKVLVEGDAWTVVRINEMDAFGWTPLHSAAQVLSHKCVGLLLQKNARTDIRSKDRDALLPLEVALFTERMQVSWYLEESVEKLLVLLRERGLDTVRLLAEATKEVSQVAYKRAIEGRIIELAILLLVATERVKSQVTICRGGVSIAECRTTIYQSILEEALALWDMEKRVLLHNPALHDTYSWDLVQDSQEKRKLLAREIELLHLFGAVPEDVGIKKGISPPLQASKHPIHPSGADQKIFVSGLPASVDTDYLKEFFQEEFGPVEDVEIIGLSAGNQMQSRFGFVTFKQEDTVAKAVETHFINILGMRVEIRSAVIEVLPEAESIAPYSKPQLIYQKDLGNESDESACCLESQQKMTANGEAVVPLTEQSLPQWVTKFRTWLPIFLEEACQRLGKGVWYPLSSLKGDFRATCGLELDHVSLGYLKLSDFMYSLPRLCKMRIVRVGNSPSTHMVLFPMHSMPQHESPPDCEVNKVLDTVNWRVTSTQLSDAEHPLQGRSKKGTVGLEHSTSSGGDGPSVSKQPQFSYFSAEWDFSLFRNDKLCTICYSRAAVYRIVPCGHKICRWCYFYNTPVTCVYCRVKVELFIPPYDEQYPPLGSTRGPNARTISCSRPLSSDDDLVCKIKSYCQGAIATYICIPCLHRFVCCACVSFTEENNPMVPGKCAVCEKTVIELRLLGE